MDDQQEMRPSPSLSCSKSALSTWSPFPSSSPSLISTLSSLDEPLWTTNIMVRQKKKIWWLSHCLNHCLPLLYLIITSTTVKISEAQESTDIHKEYQEFQEVFSRSKASGLLPLWSYDCTLELLLGTISKHNLIYTLSLPVHRQRGNMSKRCYNRGTFIPLSILRPQDSSSKGKKTGALWPYIDFWGFNQTTVEISIAPPTHPVYLGTSFSQNITSFAWKMGFSPNLHQFLCCILPYGISCTLFVFHCLMNERGAWKTCDVFQNQLYVKGEKSEFHGYHLLPHLSTS